MSDLLKITIEQVDGIKCIALLESVHPDQTEIPCVENVAFQIIIDAYKEFGPFEKHPCKEKMDKWLSFMYRQEIVITEEEFKKYDSGEVEMPSDCNCLNWDEFNGGSMMRKENNKEFVRAANNQISNIELVDLVMKNDLPIGKLVFEAFEADLLAHLKSGMTWRSAMYDRSYFI